MRKLLLAVALAVPAAVVLMVPANADYYCAGFDRMPSASGGQVYSPVVSTSPPSVIVREPDLNVVVDDGNPYVKRAEDTQDCHGEGEEMI